MSERFDPYYTWLGIPPHEQPANHYRLLGISLFESNEEVISNAADRLMLHLRAFQGGKRSKESQRLLNEISAARVCLLNRETKTTYDQKLRAIRQASEATAAKPAEPSETVASLPAVSTGPNVRSRGAGRSKAKSPPGIWLVAASVAVLILGGGVALVLFTLRASKPTAQIHPQASSKPEPNELSPPPTKAGKTKQSPLPDTSSGIGPS